MKPDPFIQQAQANLNDLRVAKQLMKKPNSFIKQTQANLNGLHVVKQ